ncbi:MAG: uracil-DNA glycosylase [Armatimonadetes bacterium]|nr:uracil-DNA glycosylase [Armatimonadota bacterium]
MDTTITSITQQIEELREQCFQCTQCELAKTRQNVVFGEGNPETPLMIIGEGPGQTEDATGRPFVGRAGALLDEALGACRISRKHVFICNVLKCRACIIENSRTRNRPPSTSEIETCTPWLEKQIETIKPLVILCLGAPSSKFVIKKDFKMTQERGIFFPTKYARHAIAALHPAYILRQAGTSYDEGKALLIADIEAARKKVIEVKNELKTTSD